MSVHNSLKIPHVSATQPSQIGASLQPIWYLSFDKRRVVYSGRDLSEDQELSRV